MNDEIDRITIDSQVCFGKPCIRGRRIWVSLIVDLLAHGKTNAEICQEYGIEELDVRACLAYAARIADERVLEIGLSA